MLETVVQTAVGKCVLKFCACLLDNKLFECNMIIILEYRLRKFSYFVRRQTSAQQWSSKFVTDMQSFIKRDGKPRIDWPATTHPIGYQILDHVLYGDRERNIGRHLHGQGIVGKREFSESWDTARIECSIAQVMERPLWARHAAHEFRPTIFGAEIDGVQIAVDAYLYQERYVIERAYPVGGEGVIMNMKNGDKIEIKESRAKVWIGA